ncbi:MAG: cadherin-like beta sandwich domain-containing protein [Chthoniobacter sp.]|nr:cadherin-like beta sandwich domain-containing protein [Chthoniobacter sp.]
MRPDHPPIQARPRIRTFLITFLICALAFRSAFSAHAAVVNATFNAATDVPITAGSYTATGNTVNLTLNFAPTTGTNLTVVKNTGLGFISGTFGNLTQGQTVLLAYNGITYNFVANYYGGTGNDLVLLWGDVRPMAWGYNGGYNGEGQLGNNSTTNSLVPVAVDRSGVLAGKTVTALSASFYHSLALCSDGTVTAWGNNGWGQLGNNTTISSLVPVAVDRSGVLVGKTVIAVSAGEVHSLALCSDGTVAAWGNGFYGSLGNNSRTSSSVPVAVLRNGALAGKTVIAVAAGGGHSLALCSDGTVAAWGWNVNGELGNGNTTDSLAPVTVPTGKTVIAIAAGYHHSLALYSDGTIGGWGANGGGQLGNNSTADSSVPVAVTQGGILAGKTVTAVAAGTSQSLALCSDGTLAAWGYNGYGQLGDNSNWTDSSVPVAVVRTGVLAGKTVTGLTGGYYHSMALCSDGTAVAWGSGFSGELGNNTTSSSQVPVVVSTATLVPGERFVAIARVPTAEHNLALVATPPPPPTVATLASTAITTTGATLNGTVNANTSASAAVSFDYGVTTAYGTHVAGTPAQVAGGSTTAVSATLTGLIPGTIYHFRVNGQSPAGTTNGNDLTFTALNTDASLTNLALGSGILSPVFASGTPTYSATTANSSVTVVPTATDRNATIRVNGTVVASGAASGPIPLSVGQNTITTVVTATDGVTTQTYTTTVTRAPLIWTYTAASDVPDRGSTYAASGAATLALNFAPTAGTNLTVVQNTGLSPISGAFSNLVQGQVVPLIYNGITYTFVVNYYGGTGNDLVLQWATVRPLAWGRNDNGQLGINSPTQSNVPVAVSQSGVLAGKIVIAVAEGGYHSVALCSDGTLAAWGLNYRGELGNNSINGSNIPVAVDQTGVLAGKTVIQIAVGFDFSLALCSDGTVASWGYNQSGQLGNNSTSITLVPVAVNRSGILAGKTVVAVAAGTTHSLALCSDGTLAAWGDNFYGVLGNNSTTNSPVPVAVNQGRGLVGKTVIAIAAGGFHSLALCADGTLAAWGDNSYGMLGNNTVPNSLEPMPVDQTGVLAGKKVVAVAAGWNHNLALCADGTLAAWGRNDSGQLGNNTTTTAFLPLGVDQTGVLSGKTVLALTAGTNYSLALCADGTLAAWGENYYGEIGNNSTTNSLVPVAVSTTALAAGERPVTIGQGPTAYHNLALAAAPQPPPTVTSLAATAIAGTSATLNGTVNANRNSATVSFDYGTSTAYGTTVTGTPTPVTGNTAVAVSTSLTGLSPGTTYHFRASGSSLCGTGNGSDLTFTTLSDNANLANLTLSSGTLNPVFGSGTTNYTTSVPTSTTSVTVTPIVAQANATVKINNATVVSGHPSTPIALSFGPNTITTVVTAPDGVTTKSYTITVYRLLSTNANLSNLTLGSGTLSPDFSSGTTAYVSTTTGSGVTVTPVTSDTNATITVNGMAVTSGSVSGPITLNIGTNTITTVVTAQDGITTQTYTVTVTRVLLSWTYNSATDVPVSAGSYIAGDEATLALNFAPSVGTNLTVVRNTGLGFISGAFSNLAQGQVVPLTFNGVTYTFVANYYGGTGNDLVLQWANVRPLAWALNANGQLGNNSTTGSSVPVTVLQSGVLAGKIVIAEAEGAAHSLALCSDGTLTAWGYNGSGQLGNNSTTQSKVPVAVLQSGVLAGKTIVAVAAGVSHSLALCSDGTLAAWGDNASGQLGNNSTTNSSVPVLVIQSGALAGKKVIAVSAGDGFSLALCSDGMLAAWGLNSNGQLGNSSTTTSLVPVLVVRSAALSGKTVIAVSSGTSHSLALCSDGKVVSWGLNSSGQLGNFSFTQSTVPVAVFQSFGALAGKSVTAITGGGYHSLVQCADGTLAAWGRNDSGQLGNNTTAFSSYPAAVQNGVLAGKTVVAVSAGAAHSLALCADGTLAAWGFNADGELGNGNTTNSLVPVAVSTAALATGERLVMGSSGPTANHTLALVASPPPTATTLAAAVITTTGATLNGTINANGNSVTVSFDYGTTTAYGSNVAATPAGGTSGSTTAVSAILTGLTPGTTYHFRAKATNAGSASYGGDLTFATPPPNANLTNLALSNGTLSPAFVSATTAYVANTTSSIVTLTPKASDTNATILVNGAVVASGSASGPIALNVGMNPITTVVTTADGLTTQTYTTIVTRAPLSSTYSTASDIPDGGSSYAASGTATLTLNFAPPVGTNLMVVQNTGQGFISGAFDNLAHGQVVPLAYNGIIYTFVANYYGGTGNDLVLQWANVRSLAWGRNTNGQLGNNSTTTSNVPVGVVQSGVLAGRTVIAVAAGSSHSLALCSDGTLAAWGLNSNGQLGNSSTTQSTVPVAVNQSGVLAGKTVIAVASGGTHSLALCADGTVAAWGANSNGQLGNNSTTLSNVPAAVLQNGALAGKVVIAVAAGSSHSLALCSDGTLTAWGLNSNGQLGNNSTTQSNVPVVVSAAGLGAGERFVTVGSGPPAFHSLALVGMAPPPPPTATTLTATSITATSATLNGAINANGSSTAVSFDYGSSVAYATNVAGTPTPVTGGSATAVSALLTGLTPGTTYHFRVNGVSAGGTANGSDASFTTLSNNANLADLALSSGILSPAFVSGTTTYSTTTTASNLTVTPTGSSSNATITVNGAGVASGSATGAIALNPGPNTITIVITAADSVTTQTYTVNVTRQTVIAAWRQAYFGTTANAGDAADTADPDGDGVSNIMELASGTNPTQAQTVTITVADGSLTQRGAPTTMVSNLGVGVDYRAMFGRRKDYVTAGLTYTIQFSGDLITWDNNTSTPIVIADDGTIEAVTVRYPFFSSNGKKARFFRVQVTLAP